MSKAKSIRILPPVEYLRACFSYNQKTGVLKWKNRPQEHFASYEGWVMWNSKNAGNRTGHVHNDGRHVPRFARRVKINRIAYWEHRIIWKIMTGAEPGENLDHADGNPLNNAWTNLRPANHFEQSWNRRLRYDNKFGCRGIFPRRNKWQAKIFVHGKNKHIGMFDTPEEASAAYENEARKLHGEFYREQI